MSAKWLKTLVFSPLLFAMAAPAATPTDDENHFLVGYQAYLQHNWDICAGQLLRAEDLPDSVADRAHLYLAACQEKLGYRAAAAANIDNLDAKSLPKDDRPVLEQLRVSLHKELADLGRLSFVLMPYAGTLGYSGSGNTKDAGQFYGAFAAGFYRVWTARVGYESATIDLKPPLKSYTQSAQHVDLARWFGASFELRGGYSAISASDSGLDGISALHLGGTYFFNAANRLALRVDNSNYPNSTLGSLQTNEGTLTYGRRFMAEKSFTLWGQAGAQLITAAASKTTDATTKFQLKSSYQRFFGDVTMTIKSFDLAIGGWSGNEAFGIREDGFVIYNSLEEHSGGWNLGLTYHVNDAFAAKVATSSESYTVSGPSLQGSVLSAGLIITL